MATLCGCAFIRGLLLSWIVTRGIRVTKKRIVIGVQQASHCHVRSEWTTSYLEVWNLGDRHSVSHLEDVIDLKQFPKIDRALPLRL